MSKDNKANGPTQRSLRVGELVRQLGDPNLLLLETPWLPCLPVATSRMTPCAAR